MTKNCIQFSYILLLFLTSCMFKSNSDTSSQISMPDIDVPLSKNGEFIELIAPIGWNSFVITEPVALEVTNVSDNVIFFPPDFGVRLFVFQNHQWIEFKNAIGYTLRDPILLKPNKDHNPLETETLFVYPELENYNHDITLRIIVIGKLTSTDNGTPITSFIDIILTTIDHLPEGDSFHIPSNG